MTICKTRASTRNVAPEVRREVVGIAALVWVLAASPITCSAQVTSQPADRSSDAAIVASFSPAPQRDGMNASGNEAGTQWGESMRASTWVGPPDTSFIASFASAPQQQDATNVSGNAACPQGDNTATTSTQSTCVRQYKTLLRRGLQLSQGPIEVLRLLGPRQVHSALWLRQRPLFDDREEPRERYEFFRNENAGAAPADSHGNNNDFTERYMLNADLHLGQYFRVFTDFMSGEEDGRIGGARPGIDRDAFDIHQGFFDLVLPVANGNGNDNDTLTAHRATGNAIWVGTADRCARGSQSAPSL